MTGKADNKTEIKKAQWFDGIKPESIKKAIEVGVIYPKFKAYKDTVYRIHIISEPNHVDNEKGNFWTIDIEKDNMKYTLNMNESFKFQLFKLLTEKKTDLLTLIQKNVPLYISQDQNGFWSVQLT